MQNKYIERLPYALIVYLLVIFCIRTFLVAGGSNDDGEQLFYSQIWALGYEIKNPPLYTWLVNLVQIIFGATLLSITLTKFILLGLIYFLFYQCARQLNLEKDWRIICMIAPLGVYYIAWDAVRNYSHSILLILSCLLTLSALFTLLDKNRIKDYVVFSIVISIGFLSKINFFIFFIALVLALLSIPEFRQRLNKINFAFAIIFALIVVSPSWVWMLAEWNQGKDILSNKFEINHSLSFVERAWLGMEEIAESLFMMIFPLSVFFLITMPRVFIPFTNNHHRAHSLYSYQSLLRNWFFILLAIVTSVVLLSGTTNIRTHIFFIFLPVILLLITRAQILNMSATRQKILVNLCLALALLVPAVLLYKLNNDPYVEKRKPYFNINYQFLADKLKQKGFKHGTIITYDGLYKLAGNIRPFFNKSTILAINVPRFVPVTNNNQNKQCLMLWETKYTDTATDYLITPQAALLNDASTEKISGEILVPMKYAEDKTLSFSYILVKESSKNCMNVEPFMS